ncbi:hypothetical protein DM02DRAFT_220458 [Periconia macrospinosa]|uniref:Uncharacterized protein n=1 Tax=Periconia macrospinosa TaxID=97972 RepID=A0A2V1D8R0_9PLEO|nr:hypothetical protein DM02DRAFT_220458 [Periconia macrospinosa]
MVCASRDSNSLGHGTTREAVEGCGWTPRFIDTAHRIMTDSPNNKHSPTGQSVGNPSNYSRVHASASLNAPPCGGGTFTPALQDGGITKDNVSGKDVQYTYSLEVQKDNIMRIGPHSFTVRATNRCNETPLATIVEQGSVPSLRSQDSPSGSIRFPRVRKVENVSPARDMICGFDKTVLDRLDEGIKSGDDKLLRPIMSESQLDDCSSKSHLWDAVDGSTSFADYEHCQPGVLGLVYEMQQPDDTLAGCVRGTVQHIKHGPLPFPLPVSPRGRSRPRTVTSAAGDMHDSHIVGKSLSPDYLNTSGVGQSQYPPKFCAGPEKASVSANVEFTDQTASLFPSAEPRSHARNREALGMHPETLAEVHTSGMQAVPLPGSQNVDACPLPRPLSFPNLSGFRHGGEAASNMHLVPPKPCKLTPAHLLAKTTTLEKDEVMARSVGGCPSSPALDASPWCSNDNVQDTSKNASFCSTFSTSYSGTVLGIDLDLEHDFERSARHTESPVWFTPIEESERKPYAKMGNRGCTQAVNTTPGHAITSPALSALLPIAAAEGIVRANFQTPRISFYSPSGNLIEEYTGSPLPRRSSQPKPRSPSTITTSCSQIKGPSKSYDDLAATFESNPSRSAAVQVITPPQLSAPLPCHLRSHSQQVKQPQSVDVSNAQITCIRVDPAVKGCGGMVLDTPVGTQSHTITSVDDTGSGCFIPSFCGSEASRSRSLKFPIWHAPKEGRTLKKHRPSQRAGNGLGLVAGHMMRVCFCQPYDGVGGKSKEMGCGVGLGN